MTLVVCSILCISANFAYAQPTNAVLSWEFSADNGVTWVPNSIVVPNTTPTTVIVRGMVAWQSHTTSQDGFVSISFDPFVQRAPGSGTSDWIADPLVLVNGGLVPRSFLVVSAFPNLLKIDRDTDLLPPGEGTHWVSSAQTPLFEHFSTSNPIEVLSYTYLLDGTPGVREVSSVLAMRPDGTNSQFVDLDFGISTPLYVPVSQLPGTITVVPSPAPLATLALGGGWALTRRRRR